MAVIRKIRRICGLTPLFDVSGNLEWIVSGIDRATSYPQKISNLISNPAELKIYTANIYAVSYCLYSKANVVKNIINICNIIFLAP